MAIERDWGSFFEELLELDDLAVIQQRLTEEASEYPAELGKPLWVLANLDVSQFKQHCHCDTPVALFKEFLQTLLENYQKPGGLEMISSWVNLYSRMTLPKQGGHHA